LNTRPLRLLPRALPRLPGTGARRASQTFQSTASRPFADLPAPPQPTTWNRLAPDAPAAAFHSALERSRAPAGGPGVTLADVDAASELLRVEARTNDGLRGSTVYDGLRADAMVLARRPAADPLRQPALNQLFQRLVVLMASHAPALLTPRYFWTTTSVPQMPPVSAASELLGSFQLASGQVLLLTAEVPQEPQALGRFFEGLSDASFDARFPRQGCGRAQMATQIVMDARHPMVDQRSVTLVLRDEAQHIVGLLDYHRRPESMMRDPVEAAQAAGQPLPRPGLKTCELNVVIADVLQGQGLGPRLLASGMAHASRAGHQQLVAVIATANHAIQGCLTQMGASAGVPLLDRGYELRVLNPKAVRG
jgi:RimJ/RimL family protein N-acetyltransferase